MPASGSRRIYYGACDAGLIPDFSISGVCDGDRLMATFRFGWDLPLHYARKKIPNGFRNLTLAS